MPNSPGVRVLAVVLAVAFVATLVSLVNAHRAAGPPIVVQTPAGAPMPLPMPASASSPPVKAASAPLPPPPTAVPVPAAKPAVALIYVHVAGAVKHPSLYQLAEGSRVWHAIKAAGGANANADEDAVNLAAKVQDGEKVFVPTKAAAARSAPVMQEAASVVSAPAVVKAAKASVGAKSKGAEVGKPAKLVSASQGQVNINTASAEQLQALPGIGPAMAARVIGYRQQAGGFQKPEDLMSVGGIGPKKFAKIGPLIKLH